MLTEGATATVVCGGAEDLDVGCAARDAADRLGGAASLVDVAGAVFRATRSVGGERWGLGAGGSFFFGDASVVAGGGALSARTTGVAGAGAGADVATRP